MIIKSFEINKIKPLINNLILFYGQNEGFKEQALKQISSSFQNILKYNEKEILDKGKGAFFSSGSRPGQTPQSWAFGRLASVILKKGTCTTLKPNKVDEINIWNLLNFKISLSLKKIIIDKIEIIKLK